MTASETPRNWPADPFSFKRWSKRDLRRIVFVGWSRLQERRSRWLFSRARIPLKLPDRIEPALFLRKSEDSAVNAEQATCLLAALRATENMSKPVVEIGCYRGVMTTLLATNTTRQVIGVDPFAGYGGAEADRRIFEERTRSLSNVKHLALTSGEAARLLVHERFSFVFVDAVHDYVNTRFDAIAWSSLLQDNGIIAFHDTDDGRFPGTRRAVFELIQHPSLTVEAHVPNLVVLRKRT